MIIVEKEYFTTYVVETKFTVKAPDVTKPKFLITIN